MQIDNYTYDIKGCKLLILLSTKYPPIKTYADHGTLRLGGPTLLLLIITKIIHI
jgi:hypothetical protein